MEKTVRKYALRDSTQELDEKEFWKNQTYEYKIHVLESLRRMWFKMNPNWQENGDLKGLRRVFRIVKRA
jgi:hypothetical protein